MQFNFIFAAIFIQALGAFAIPFNEAQGATTVLTAERIFQTVVNFSPFMVERTSTIIWTLSEIPSATESGASLATVTPAPASE